MTDNLTLVEVSAFSGLAGGILSQALTGLFAYIGDKRKADIDVKKAYDNVELWGLEYILGRDCFNKRFIDLIKAIYTNNKGDVITPYGASDKFDIT